MSPEVGQLQFYLFDRVSNDAAISERLELLHFQMLQLGRFAALTEAWVLDLDEEEVGISLKVGRASAFRSTASTVRPDALRVVCNAGGKSSLSNAVPLPPSCMETPAFLEHPHSRV